MNSLCPHQIVFTNENANGLIRQCVPKGENVSWVNQVVCNRIERELNSRPRRRLGFKAPKEVSLAQIL